MPKTDYRKLEGKVEQLAINIAKVYQQTTTKEDNPRYKMGYLQSLRDCLGQMQDLDLIEDYNLQTGEITKFKGEFT